MNRRPLFTLLGLLLAVAMLLPLAGCAKPKQPFDPFAEEETPTQTETYPVFEEVFGDVRVQIYNSRVLRLEVKGANGFVDANTFAISDRTSWEGTKVERAEAGDVVTLTTPGYVMTVPKTASDLKEIVITDPEGKNLWKYTSKLTSFVDLPSPSKTPAVWGFGDSPRIIPTEQPFIAAEKTDEKDEFNNWGYEKTATDYYLFVTGGDAWQLREDFVHLTGRCDMVPLKVLGMWFSRYHAYTDEEFLALIDDFRAHGYPMDMLVVDTDWRQSGDGTGYKISKKYFPDIDGFFDKTDAANVYVIMNDHVRACKYSMLSKTQLDWFNKGLRSLLDHGLTAWWYDRNWTNAFKSPFKDIPGDLLGQYFYQWITRDNKKDDSRTFMMSNIYFIYNGSYGSEKPHVAVHRHNVQWTGDIASNAESLRQEIENMVKVGVNTSLGYYSSDIAGHTGNPTEPLFIRWTQYAALSPIMRYHSTSSVPARIPWEIGETADKVCSAYMQMRYRLMPLFYTSAYENYAKGLPIARRLDFYYPDLLPAKGNDQYLLGDDILVAPYYDGAESTVPSEWLKTASGETGLTCSFYNGMKPEGDVIGTRVDADVNFNWGNGSPMSGVPSDSFSAVWEGKITLPAGDDVRLGILSDDGARLYIDGKMVIDNWKDSFEVTVYTESALKAGSTHDIKLEYFENGGGAVAKLLYAVDTSTSTRKVYVPTGTWMNLFTGEQIVGPQSIEVTMGIEQSPIFVKMGSTTVLTKPGDHAEESDWQNITLDIYAAKAAEGEGWLKDETTQYEDDGTTEAYKSGNYRLTTYKTAWSESGELFLKSVTEQKNGNPSSFETRKVTLRIHAEALTELKLNGEALTFTQVEQDSAAYPFAVEGGSPDGTVFTATFELPVGEDFVITGK